jgi:hypothetical protein
VLPVSMFKVRGESTKALSHFSSHFSVVYIPIFSSVSKASCFQISFDNFKRQVKLIAENHGCEYLGSFRMGTWGGTCQ